MIEPRRQEWTDRAACADHKYVPAEAWVAEVDRNRGVTATDVRDMRNLAAAVCNTCPVRVPCGATAEAARLAPDAPGQEITVRPFGVLGGMFYDSTKRPPKPAAESTLRVLPPLARSLRTDERLTEEQREARRIDANLRRKRQRDAKKAREQLGDVA